MKHVTTSCATVRLEVSTEKLHGILDNLVVVSEFVNDLSKFLEAELDFKKELFKFFFCPYCHSALIAFIEEKHTYECGYSGLNQGVDNIEFEDLIPCPNKAANQEKWNEEWWDFFDKGGKENEALPALDSE